MKNKKVLKRIATIAVGLTMGMSIFSFAACANDDNSDNNGNNSSIEDNNGSENDFNLDDVTVPAPKLPTYTGNGAALVAGQETVKYEFLADDLETGTFADGWSNGSFSLVKNSKIRARAKSKVYIDKTQYSTTAYQRSVHMGDDTTSLVFNAPKAGTLYIHVQNGSGTVVTQALILTSPDGSTSEVSYPGTSNNSNIQRVAIEIKEPGEYSLKRKSGTSDLFYAEFSTTLENSPIEKIEVVDSGKSDYLLTQQLDCTGIKINAVHADTGKIAEVDLSNVVFDTSTYNAKVSGTYSIGVSYTVDGNLTSETKTFTATYEVKVYTVSEIKLDTTLTQNEKQTTVQTSFLPNSTFNSDGLTVTAMGKLGNDTTSFIMNSNDYTIKAPDLSTQGKKKVEVSVNRNYANGATVNANYEIVVKDKITETNNELSLTVGGETGDFKTVTQALSYIKVCGYADDVVKKINIADGDYYEKIHISIPNVHLIGSANNTPDATTNNGVVLWYDAANGTSDPSGAAYGTKGSASVTVATTARNFVAENITFKNYYNNSELYYELKANTSGTQAVALLVESPSATFLNCKMTGYQDTLYANKGYQFYYKCWIEGRTDYIFGADAIPYFYDCSIYTVTAGAKDGDGGYIVAYQNTSTAYGPIFNKCNIMGAEQGATNIALGRAWGKECHMVTMNSTISANYSKVAHTATTQKGQRYVTMGGNEPKAANMKEYNNTGDGAITASIANTCTVITETEAMAYQLDKVTTLLKFTPYDFTKVQ